MVCRSGPVSRALSYRDTPEHIRGHHEQLIGVQRRVPTDQAGPPARRGLRRAGRTDDMRVTGKGMLDQDGIVSAFVQGAPRLVGHHDIREQRAVLQLQPR